MCLLLFGLFWTLFSYIKHWCWYVQVGNHIDVQKGVWTATDAGIGAGVDSYFEYLVKGASLFSDKKLLTMFHGKPFSLSLLSDLFLLERFLLLF